ncbi:MAG: 50S ribosomal protein L17 [Bacteroidota bacterium]
MRHGKKFNHLGRTASHRKAMLANMACSLIEHKRIKTTLAKAKALRKYVEPLITKSKLDTMHSRRVVFSYLQNKEAIKELFGEVSNAVAERPGGYTRILKLGPRASDNAEMALIELVDFNELAPGKAAGSKSKSSRRRRGKGKKKKAAETTSAVVEEAVAVEEAPVVEEVVEEVEAAVEEVTEVVEEAPAEEVVEAVEEAVVEEAPVEVEEVVEEAPVEEAIVEEAPAEEVVAEAPAEEPAPEPVAEAAPAPADDLKKIEGIGPKIASILNEAGITTFAALAGSEADKIREILAAAGNRYKAHDPTTWPRQAQLAADGAWDELKALQDDLKGGKEA